MTCQIGNLKIKKKVKPVKVVNYNINAANCDVISMMQYITLFAKFTQPKYRDLSTNNTCKY